MKVEYTITTMGGDIISGVELPPSVGFRLILRNFCAEVNNPHTWRDGLIAVDVHGVKGDLDMYETHTLTWNGTVTFLRESIHGEEFKFLVADGDFEEEWAYRCTWGRLYGSIENLTAKGEQ